MYDQTCAKMAAETEPQREKIALRNEMLSEFELFGVHRLASQKAKKETVEEKVFTAFAKP